MITGYAQIDMQKMDKVFDYCGCMYPEGVISTQNTMLFNHDDIDKIFCIGYSDDDQKKFNTTLIENTTEEKIKLMLEKAKQKTNIESL